MAEVLYRKYRPQKFGEVKSQDMVVTTLVQAIKSGNFAHAYLFTGPRGTGKTSLARLVAKGLNCEKFESDKDVCNECAECLAFNQGNFPDLYEIDAASNRGIDEIRELRENINFLPTQSTHKVYIIDEVHMLTREAFNALLKTLEEPPSHIVFLLATTEPHKIPATILSRVQRFDLSLGTKQDVVTKLSQILKNEKVLVDEEVLDMVYEQTGGSFRDAESLLGKLIQLAGKKSMSKSEAAKLLGVAEVSLVNNLLSALYAGSLEESMQQIEMAVQAGVNLVGLAKQLGSKVHQQIVSQDSPNMKLDLKLLQLLVQLQADSKYVDDTKLLWDILILQVCEAKGGNTAHPPKVPKSPLPQKPADNSDHSSPVVDNNEIGDQEIEETANLDAPINAGIDELWPNLLDLVRKQDFKIWNLLRGCNPEMNGNSLVLSTRYKYNYDNLQKPQMLNKIATVFRNHYNISSVEIGLDKEMGEQDLPIEASNVNLVESIL